MYTIELTVGAGWDAPVTEVHPIRSTIHIVDIERRAEALLWGPRGPSKSPRATNYRILDPLGRCVRSSVTAKSSKTGTRHAGRTCWI